MIISDFTLKKQLASGELYISPIEERQIQPASIYIRLGNTFGIVEDNCDGILQLENLDRKIFTSPRTVCFSNNHGIYSSA